MCNKYVVQKKKFFSQQGSLGWSLAEHTGRSPLPSALETKWPSDRQGLLPLTLRTTGTLGNGSQVRGAGIPHKAIIPY